MSGVVRSLAWLLIVLAAIIASFVYLEMDSGGLFSAKGLGQMLAYAGDFLSPDLSAPHLKAVGQGCWKRWPCQPSAPCSPH